MRRSSIQIWGDAMKDYIRLARPHHWIKNLLVVLPLLCSGQFLETGKLLISIWAFLAFSFLASAIYVNNDIRDCEKDRLNPRKCERPIAAGRIGVRSARIYFAVLLGVTLVFSVLAAGQLVYGWCLLAAYLFLNLAYSMKLKNIPVVDIAILAAGYLLRMLFGSAVTGIELSSWLCLTVIAASFFMGLGKRRGELKGKKDYGESTRKVLQYYSEGFLDRNMTVCIGLAIMFYSLWTVDSMTVARVGSDRLVWTVPVVLLLCMKYSLDIEGESDGDPIEVLLHDPVILLLGGLLALMIFYLIYL